MKGGIQVHIYPHRQVSEPGTFRNHANCLIFAEENSISSMHDYVRTDSLFNMISIGWLLSVETICSRLVERFSEFFIFFFSETLFDQKNHISVKIVLQSWLITLQISFL